MTKQNVFEQLKASRRTIRSLGVQRLAVFGSVVRGEATEESDVDVLVQFEPGGKTFDHFLALAAELEAILGRPVELLTTESLSPYMAPRILGEAQDVPLRERAYSCRAGPSPCACTPRWSRTCSPPRSEAAGPPAVCLGGQLLANPAPALRTLRAGSRASGSWALHSTMRGASRPKGREVAVVPPSTQASMEPSRPEVGETWATAPKASWSAWPTSCWKASWRSGWARARSPPHVAGRKTSGKSLGMVCIAAEGSSLSSV